MIGSLSAICPEKRPDIVSVAVRAFVAGSIICFINAAIAGKWKRYSDIEYKVKTSPLSTLGLLMTTDNYEILSNSNGSLY